MSTIEVRLTGNDAQRVLVCGRSGMGKTTFARVLAGGARRAVWIDPKGLNEIGWPVIVKADRFADLPSQSAKAALLRRLLEEHTRIVVQLADRPDYAEGNPERSDQIQVDSVCEAAYTLGNVLWGCDDMQGVYTSRPTYYLHRVATMGRSRGVGALCLVTSVIGFPLDFLRSTNHVVSFAMHEDEEVSRLRKVRAELGSVATLEPREYLWADLDGGRVHYFDPLPVSAPV